MFKLKKLKKFLMLTATAMLLVLCFQNCGEYSAEFSLSDVGLLEVNPEVPIGTQLASPVWKMSSREDLPSMRVYFADTQGTPSPQGLRIEILEGKRKKILSGVGGTINSFKSLAPQRIKSDRFPGAYNLYFFNDARDEVLAVSVKETEVSALWVAELQTAVSANDFANLTVKRNPNGLKSMKIGSVTISRLEESPPTIEVEGTDGCRSNEHIENGSCVPNVKTCSISNGVGQQEWANNNWSACKVQSCLSGYYKSGNTCKAVPNCNSSQHLENYVCVANTRTCAVANGTGNQTWSGSAWGSCIVRTCNSNATQVGNTCILKSTCPAGQHSENGTCVPSTRTCSIPNGTGSQTWSGNTWGNCRPQTCNTGYYKNGLACSLIPTCAATEHVENNACVANERTCVIANGVAKEEWNKDTKRWGSCTLVGCYSGYRKSGNACYVVVTCKSDEHQEGNSCVPNSRACNITNGKGTQTWNGSDWRACTNITCNAGFYKKNSSEDKCYAVPTCPEGQYFNPLQKKCTWNHATASCTVDNGIGETTWNITKNEWNTCTVTRCYDSYYMTYDEKNKKTCAPRNVNNKPCKANQYWSKGVCVSKVRSCTLANATKAEQTWEYKVDAMTWSACRATQCANGYSLLSGTCRRINDR